MSVFLSNPTNPSSSSDGVGIDTATVVNNALIVKERIFSLTQTPEIAGGRSVRLVAVSKTKPVEAIAALYEAGE